MEPLAHSAREKEKILAQLYKDHVENVVFKAINNVSEAVYYYGGKGEQLMSAVRLAATFHDLGKLDQENQNVLSSGAIKKKLPIDHQDAGAAYLCSPSLHSPIAGCLVAAHHSGLPDFNKFVVLEDGSSNAFRSDVQLEDGRCVKNITDLNLSSYIRNHNAALSSSLNNKLLDPVSLFPLDIRILLSALVDADHTDTAQHYKNPVPYEGPLLNAKERLAFLDQYVDNLSKEKKNQRTNIRNEVYGSCRNAKTGYKIYACDSPVGTGKTTAVMAHLLHTAIDNNLRRVFVVLPFTNIIDQSVEVYRNALVAPYEHLQDVVAAHHHKAEFEDIESRQFSFLWHAPIVVVTAVQFFETLASSSPSSLRKLHQLPGSAIFIDEAHAALPTHLLPQAWKWLNHLCDKWGCHLVLGSGSLHRFWELGEFADANSENNVPDLIPEKVRKKVACTESKRIAYKTKTQKMGLDDLIGWISDQPGPRLLIVNTVQTAAVIARKLAGPKNENRFAVEHLSTALCPKDRKKTLKNIKKRLKNKNDTDWTLVATSCVEAGVDLSFRTGFRERASLNSLIQTGGRVNRQGETIDAELWDFKLIINDPLKDNPVFKSSSRVLEELFNEGNVSSEFSTEAMRRELRIKEIEDSSYLIQKAERSYDFPTVEEKFKVIPDNTITAVVDENIISQLKKHEKIDFDMIQQSSVAIYLWKIKEYDIQEFERYPGLYWWNLAYDDFIGYMAGVLQSIYPEEKTIII